MPKKFKSQAEKRTYKSWIDMRHRCKCPNHPRFHRYGGAGVTFSPAWESFDTFVQDLGLRPDGLTLFRIDKTKPYQKDNCRWGSPAEQTLNRIDNVKYEYDGKSLTIKEWSDLTQIPRRRLQHRLVTYRWPVEVALTAPPYFKYNPINFRDVP